MSARVVCLTTGSSSEARTIQALCLSAGSYEVIGGLDETGPTALPTLDGLTLDPAAVWR
jgi:hypothetical protein